MKRRLLQAISLVAIATGIALALPSCGGGDDIDGKKQIPEPVKRGTAT